VNLFAGSKPAGTPVVDLEPARLVIGYEPRDTYPTGLPFDA